MTKPKRYKRFSSEFKREAIMRASEEGMSRKLLDFLGLDWDDACLSYFNTDRTVATPSRWQVRQPIYKSSVSRWKRYERHLDPLKQALGDLFRGD